jgi:hypothetical protein
MLRLPSQPPASIVHHSTIMHTTPSPWAEFHTGSVNDWPTATATRGYRLGLMGQLGQLGEVGDALCFYAPFISSCFGFPWSKSGMYTLCVYAPFIPLAPLSLGLSSCQAAQQVRTSKMVATWQTTHSL